MARLTSNKRKSLPRTSFAIPSERAYPLDTIDRARNALARVEQFGTEAEKKKVRAAVKKRYPQIKQGS